MMATNATKPPVFSPAIVLAAIAAYTIVAAVFLQAFPGQRAIYAAIVLFSVGIATIGLSRTRLTKTELTAIILWLILNVTWGALAIDQQVLYPRWIVGDAMSLLFPAVLFFVGVQHRRLFEDWRLLLVFGTALMIGPMLSALIGISPNARFEAPITLLFPLAWLATMRTRGMYRALWLLFLIVLGWLAFKSGERTSFILWLLSGVTVISLHWTLRRLVVLGMLLVVVTIGLAGTAFQQVVRSSLEESRFRENIEGRVDQSLVTRLNEARDVLHYFETGSPIQKVLGHGHGATFWPVHSLTLLNLSDEGFVHHVHIGPALILYRYGLVGVLALAWLWWAVIRALLRLRRLKQKTMRQSEEFFTVAALMYLINLMLFNVIPEPVFAYVFAGFLYFQARQALITPVILKTERLEVSNAT